MKKIIYFLFICIQMLALTCCALQNSSEVNLISMHTVSNDDKKPSIVEETLSTLEFLSGVWVVKEFVGTANVHSDEEDNTEVIGNELIISEDEVDYASEIVFDNPVFISSTATYEDILITWRTNPEILGMGENTIYNVAIISDAMNELSIIRLYIIDQNHVVYNSFGKYYRLERIPLRD